MADKEYSEKRDFIRMYVNADIEFYVGGKKESFTGKSRDLSGKGISFSTSKELSAGDILQLTLTVEITKVAPLELEVKVVRVETESADSFFVAAETQR